MSAEAAALSRSSTTPFLGLAELPLSAARQLVLAGRMCGLEDGVGLLLGPRVAVERHVSVGRVRIGDLDVVSAHAHGVREQLLHFLGARWRGRWPWGQQLPARLPGSLPPRCLFELPPLDLRI